MRVTGDPGRIPPFLLHFADHFADFQHHVAVDDGVGMVEEDEVDAGQRDHLHLLADDPFVVGVVVPPQRFTPPVRLPVRAHLLVLEGRVGQQPEPVGEGEDLGGVVDTGRMGLPDPGPVEEADLPVAAQAVHRAEGPSERVHAHQVRLRAGSGGKEDGQQGRRQGQPPGRSHRTRLLNT